MPSVYILYSPSLDRFYTGATSLPVETRHERHLIEYYGTKYTAAAKDWEIFFQIDCATMAQAFQIEKHIKNMKSKKYITDLKAYPEIVQRLKEKYSV
jgi:putative endonuclease